MSRGVYYSACGAALLLIAILSIFPVQSDDIFMYLAIARRFFRDGHFPTIDPFFFGEPNYHWHILHEWASHLLFYGLYKIGSWNALIVGKTIVVLAMASIPIAVASRLGRRSWLVPLLVVLAGLAGNDRFIERSSLFSDLLTSLVVGIVLRDRAQPGRWKYALPFIFAAWVNLHPGFYPALACLCLAAVLQLNRRKEKPAQRFFFCAAASLLACMLNPRGIVGVLYPLKPIFDPAWAAYKQFNYEWIPTLSTAQSGSTNIAAFFVIAGICAALILMSLPRRPWLEIAIFALFVWQGLLAVRFLTTASFALATLGAAMAALRPSWSSTPAKKSRAPQTITQPSRWPIAPADLPNAGVALLALAAAIYFAIAAHGPGDTRHLGLGLDTQQLPIDAAAFIERINLRTSLYNQHEFGSYLAWRWDGTRQLYYHGFVDDLNFYATQYIPANNSPEDFDRIVNDHHIGAFLLTRIDITPDNTPLLYQLLMTRPDWRLVYADSRAMLWLRNIPSNTEALQAAGQELKARLTPP